MVFRTGNAHQQLRACFALSPVRGLSESVFEFTSKVSDQENELETTHPPITLPGVWLGRVGGKAERGAPERGGLCGSAGVSIVPGTRSSQVRFLIREHAWVVDLGYVQEATDQCSSLYLSFSLSLSLSQINKYILR